MKPLIFSFSWHTTTSTKDKKVIQKMLKYNPKKYIDQRVHTYGIINHTCGYVFLVKQDFNLKQWV